MALRVPADQIGHITKFLELPDEKIDKFLDALGNAGPQFNVADLAMEISERVDVPPFLADEIIRVLASIYLTLDFRIPIDKFVDRDVFNALKRAHAFPPENADVQWKRLRKFLVAALSLERSLGTAAKAGPVLTHHERIFAGARIMTDLRPIYHLDVSEKPDAAVIIHMLRITQRDNFGKQSDEYFALDSNDIATMKELVDRAEKKEKALRSLMANSGLTILNPKLFF